MEAKFSKLKLERFELLESHYGFNVPEEDVIDDIQELFNTHKVNVEFNHQEEGGRTIVHCQIEVNKNEDPGYSIMTMALGIFKIDDPSSLEESTVQNLKQYSTLNMIINNLRNIMFQTTCLGPMGGYTLPPIDVLDLFMKKRNESSSKKEA
jgi:preprotein translocase subunit SecB